MGRSLKKGPFVNKKLLERVEALNAANEKTVQDHQLFSLR